MNTNTTVTDSNGQPIQVKVPQLEYMTETFNKHSNTYNNLIIFPFLSVNTISVLILIIFISSSTELFIVLNIIL